LEAIARLAEALARMELQDSVRKDHVQEALSLFAAATVQANSNHRHVDLGAHSESEREDVKKAEQLIKVRVAIGCKVKKEVIQRYLIDQDVEPNNAKKALHILVMRRILEETTGNSYKRLA